MKKSGIIIAIAVVALLFIWGIGVNNRMVAQEENVTKAWSQVENVYQRRFDLIPQLVNTVQGAANYEKGTLTAVIEARSNVVKIDGNELTEENIKKFQSAQDQLTNALNKSISLTVERYPELTATKGFQDLQTQLEGTENRIAVERNKFNETVQTYNTLIRRFPNNIFAGIFGFEKKGYFTSAAGADKPVEVNFEF